MPKRSFLWQLAIVLVVAQVAAAIAIGAYAWRELNGLHVREETRALERLVPFVVESLRDPMRRDAPLDSALRTVGLSTDLRVTIIDQEGTVRADSDYEPAQMDNHRYRTEIDSAFETRSGSAVRWSATAQRDMIYVAQRTDDTGVPTVIRIARPLSEVSRVIDRTLTLAALGAALMIGVTACGVFLISRRMRAVIDQLTTGAERFASGRLTTRVDPTGGRELEPLAIALNEMAEELGRRVDLLDAQRAEQQAILQSMSNGMIALDEEQRFMSLNRAAEVMLGVLEPEARGRLVQEIAREPDLHRFIANALEANGRAIEELTLHQRDNLLLRAVSEPLRDASGEETGLLILLEDVTRLRQLESIRSDFAANVSHELRTPITNVKGYVETLLDLTLEDEQTRGFLEIIHSNTNRLEAIIEDLLALAALEDDERSGVERRSCPVRGLVVSVISLWRHQADEHSITLEHDIDPALQVFATPQLIEQAIGNLVSNAIHYGGSGTTVAVTATRTEDGMIAIAVTDAGPGIAQEHLPRIFERFYRVDRARSRSLGGTGLGLAIVKHVARVHGGRTEVESEVGRGSTFRLLLPEAPTKPGETPPVIGDLRPSPSS